MLAELATTAFLSCTKMWLSSGRVLLCQFILTQASYNRLFYRTTAVLLDNTLLDNYNYMVLYIYKTEKEI